MKRKVAAIDGRGVISVEEEDVPAHGPDELLVEVRASLVSPGTELGGVKGRRANPDPSKGPRAFGYQNAGVILEKGAACERFRVGQKVACMGGGYAQHATHAVVPKNLAVPIPDGLSFEEAAFNHLAATALQAVRRADVRIGEWLAVVGLGIVGQCAAQLGRIAGCYVAAIDMIGMRLERAGKLGAHATVNPGAGDAVDAVRKWSDGYGLDAAIMAFGGEGTDAFKMLLNMMKRAPDGHQMGRISIVGGCKINTGYAASAGNVDVRSSARTGPGYHDEAWERGRDYPPVFVRWDTQQNLRLCLKLMAEKRLQVDPLVTHRVPLDEAPAACEDLIQTPQKALGVILLPQ
ncbi:MAG: zinc-binding alcohol dehydrogenase [Kiritimatiellae bacterium]|nr:zinc-binding alcohol dehydrogenase [Kiritimatiellia bacterium]